MTSHHDFVWRLYGQLLDKTNRHEYPYKSSGPYDILIFYERQVKSPSTSVPHQRPLSLEVIFIQQGRLAQSLTVAFDRELEEGPTLTTAVVT